VNEFASASIVFVICVAGAAMGAGLRRILPDHHLTPESKDVVRLGSGLIATIAALVLSLLISSAKTSFDTQRGEVRQMAASLVQLDRTLALYGPEAHEIRVLLRQAIVPWVENMWHDQMARPPLENGLGTPAERAYKGIMALTPKDETQGALKPQLVQVVTGISRMRYELFEQSEGSIPPPFLAILIFWLAIIFASFSLFSPLNPMTIAALIVFALSASGAIYLILEMDHPFGGLLQISDAPLRSALTSLTP
jgi:hypothetical protein